MPSSAAYQEGMFVPSIKRTTGLAALRHFVLESEGLIGGVYTLVVSLAGPEAAS